MLCAFTQVPENCSTLLSRHTQVLKVIRAVVTRAQFAETLRRRRRDLGLSQEALIERLGILADASIVSKWENGRHLPNKNIRKALADALECSVSDLFGEAGTLGRTSSDIVQHAGGIQWRIVYPVGQQFAISDEIRTGITLLESVLQGTPSRTIDFTTYSEEILSRFAKVAISSSAFDIVAVETVPEIEQQLLEKYAAQGLKKCYVAKMTLRKPLWVEDTLVTEVVAFLAARAVLQAIEEVALERLTIGFSGGLIVNRLVELFPPAHPMLTKQKYVPLLSTPPHRRFQVLPLLANSIVCRMASRQLGSEGAELPFLEVHQRASEYQAGSEIERKTLLVASQVVANATAANMAILSVGKRRDDFRARPHQLGFPSFQEVTEHMRQAERDAYVGDVLLYLVDKSGQRVGTTEDRERNDMLVYSVGLHGLMQIARRGLVWILAASPKKSAVIHAALTAGYCNALVMDSHTALALLGE